MKKVLYFVMIVMLMFTIVGCGGTSEKQPAEQLPKQEQEVEKNEETNEAHTGEQEVKEVSGSKKLTAEELWAKEVPAVGTKIPYEIVPIEKLSDYILFVDYAQTIIEQLKEKPPIAYTNFAFDTTIAGDTLYLFSAREGYGIEIVDISIENSYLHEYKEEVENMSIVVREVKGGENRVLIISVETFPIADAVWTKDGERLMTYIF